MERENLISIPDLMQCWTGGTGAASPVSYVLAAYAYAPSSHELGFAHAVCYSLILSFFWEKAKIPKYFSGLNHTVTELIV